MRAAMSVRRLSLTLVGVLIAVIGITAVVFAAPAKPDFAMSISPASQSVQQGGNATFTVTVQATNGFTGTVSLASSGVPKGATSSLSPTSVTFVKNGTTTATSTLQVATTSSTATGTKAVTVNGNSGSVSHSVSANLTVTQLSANAPFTLGATPGSATVSSGSQAVFTVTGSAAGSTASTVSLSAVSSPAGPTLTFSPSTLNIPASGTASSSLTASASNGLAAGDYRITITGTSGPNQSQTASVLLTVSTSGKAFTMSLANSVTGLAPGAAGQPMNLSLSNPNRSVLSITNLSVSVSGISKAVNAPSGSCTVADYAVTQFTGPYPISVPAGGTVTLSGVSIPQAQWPRLAMLDDPTHPQDACKGATVNLSFSGSGTGN